MVVWIIDVTFQTLCDERVKSVITAYMKVYMFAISSGKRHFGIFQRCC